MRIPISGLSALLAATCTMLAAGALAVDIPLPKPPRDKQRIERGRYLAIVGGCNDCHSSSYAESEGRLPERYWLTGNPVGFRGFWGTTYATNLRRSLAKITEDEWVKYASTLETRPPMPWFNLNRWSEDDLRDFYHFVRHLGPLGRAAPTPVPPDQEPKGPVVTWPMPSAVGR